MQSRGSRLRRLKRGSRSLASKSLMSYMLLRHRRVRYQSCLPLMSRLATSSTRLLAKIYRLSSRLLLRWKLPPTSLPQAVKFPIRQPIPQPTPLQAVMSTTKWLVQRAQVINERFPKSTLQQITTPASCRTSQQIARLAQRQ